MKPMTRRLTWAAVAACALAVALASAPAAAARPSTDLASLRPVNKKGQLLQRVVRGRPVTLVFGFRMQSAPRSAGLRVRISYTIKYRGDVMRAMSSRAPIVYTGVYRFRMPLEVPTGFAPGRYMVRGLVEVLDGKRVVAKDWRERGLRVR
jgi:hypothetical protein